MRPFFLLAYTAVGRYHRGVASLTPATIVVELIGKSRFISIIGGVRDGF
jgi:hypothetical protein